MGKNKKDVLEKSLEAHNDVFADIMNAVLFGGKHEVAEEELEDAATVSAYWGNNGLREQNRDAAKYWKKARIRVARFGTENQTNPDPDMPLRVIGYDGAAYRDQLRYETGEDGKRRLNQDPRYPVITLVLYFGYKTRWNGPKRLTEALSNIPEEIRPFVSDYEIHIIEVAWLTDEEIERFTSDFRIVVDFFAQKRKNGDYKPTDRKIIHVNETLELLNAVTHDNRFAKAAEEGKEKPKNMCEVLDRVENRGIQKGLQKGMQKGIQKGRVMEYVALRREEGYGAESILQGLMERFRLTKEQATKYLEK